MTKDQPPSAGFSPIVPELDVFDPVASLRFWCDALGFEVAYARPEDGFAYLEREGAQVMLNRVNGNWKTGSLERPLGRGINLQFHVGTVAPILARLKCWPWPLFRPLHDAWYRVGIERIGFRQFLVQDPDGYLLRFSERLGGEDAQP
ncbi:VOC family protein [Methylobacterium sp. BTF04]|uniref:bleomycin resistance protein n=1 Tax=Methylobacterium sp. BTF04 TaxID=2708300 RepID=UPI0013D59315|nr:VOC family protein [Methylobacterium sp. BTF04]NEU11771.1 VOC family protein [Methylobacterium sp. BTF04]